MTIVDLLSQLRQVGIQLTLDGDKLKIKAPQGALTEELKEQLKQNKEAIIAFLQGAVREVKQEVFPRIDRNASLPLSYMQQGLWFVEQLTPGTAAYTMPLAFKVYGDLDTVQLQAAITDVMARQESLCMRFRNNDQGVAEVLIDSAMPVPFEVEEILLDEAAIEDEIRQRVSRQALSTFDLERGPLFRLQCVIIRNLQGEKRVNLLVGAMHHIISDGWSLNIFVRELFIAYMQKATGLAVPVPPLDVQYVDFAAWQQDYLKTEAYAKKLAYWVDHLRDIPSHLALPTDFPRPHIQGNNGSKYQFAFDPARCERFAGFCREQDVTLFMGLMAAWQFVLYKHARQEDFCLGVPTAGRNHKSLENIIGFFIDPIIVRSRLKASHTLLENLHALKQEVIEDFDNQEVPLAQILDNLQISRNPAYSPVAQVGFQLQNFSGVIEQNEAEKQAFRQIEQLTRLTIERVAIEDVASKFDMILSLSQNGTALTGYVEYNADLFTEAGIARLIAHFEIAIERLLENPALRLRDLAFHDAAELHAALGVPESHEIRPLTDVQQVLYWDSVLHPETRQNGIGLYVDLPADLDPALLEQSVRCFIAQSSSLRTRFIQCDIPWLEDVYQVVSPDFEFHLPLLANPCSDDAQLDAWCDEWTYRPYDVTQGPLFEFAMLRRHDGKLRISARGHHLVFDGATGGFWLNKMQHYYNALREGQPVPVFADRFGEYIDWRRQEVDSPETLAFWQEKLADITPLSFERIPGASRSADYEIHTVVLDATHAADVKDYCKKNRTHTQDYFRLISNLLIQHYCRPEGNFIVNEVLNNRISPRDDSTGVFYQMLPWVVSGAELAAATPVNTLLADMGRYRRETRPFRSLSSLAQVRLIEPGTINFQYNYISFFKGFTWEGEEIFFQPFSAHVERTVQVFIKELGDSFVLQAWMDRNAFDDHRFLQRMELLSSQLLAGEAQKASDFRFVLPEEKLVLAGLSQHPAQTVGDTIVSRFDAISARYAESVAVRCGSHVLRYEQLQARANRAAHRLIEHGVGPGARVAILLGRRVEMLVAVWAVLKTGASYVPVEAAYPCERINYIVSDSGARVVISESCLKGKLDKDYAGIVIDVDNNGEFDDPSLPATLPQAHVDPESEIYVIYTSGSTGQPKGASVNHKGETNLQQWYIDSLGLGANDRTLVISAFGFDLTQKNLFAMHLVGGCVVLPEMDEYDDSIVREAIRENAITLVNCAPSAFYPLAAEAANFADLKTLRWVVLGGEPIRLPLLQTWLASESCIARLVNSYGPTECTDVVAYHILDQIDLNAAGIPVGIAVPGCELHVLDAALREVAPGLIGELCVAGICVGNGYVNRPEQTADAFVDNPFGAGKLYRTGDLVRVDAQGLIHYIGRKDFQVKIRGLRIELGEIEAVLTRQAGVRDSLVMVRDDRLVAYVVGDSIDIVAMRESLRATLPDYMVPSALVPLRQWPLTPNGKVDRKALPVPGVEQSRAPFVAPRNETESRVAQIWQEVLKVDAVGVDDNFFDLGGHSLLATQIVSRVRRAFDVGLNLRELLSNPTVAGLAEALLRQGQSGGAGNIPHADRSGRLPLSHAQQRLWLLDRLEPGNIAYNVPLALRITGKLNVAALTHAISDVINRHEGLRTRFLEDESGPRQDILPLQQWETARVQLDDIVADQEFAIRRAVAQVVAHVFDLDEGPLFVSRLINVGDNDWIYAFVAHHIVTDGWSMAVFAREVVLAYLTYAKGMPLALSPLPLQYTDFAVWQRQLADAGQLEQSRSFWRSYLEDVPVLALPTDFSRPKVQTYNGSTYRFSIDSAHTGRLNHLARSVETTPFNVLLSLFAGVLSRYAGQQDFAIGTPVAGRDRVELENIIGFFVNTVAVRVRPRGDTSLPELVRETAQASSSAFEHQHLPFEDVVDLVDPVRDMSRSPLFQVMMVLQNIPLDSTGLDNLGNALGDLSVAPVDFAIETAKYDITLTLAMVGDALEASLQYNTDLFRATTVSKIARDFVALLDAWLLHPEQPLSQLQILSDAEKNHLLETVNQTAVAYEADRTVQQRVLAMAKQRPDSIAIECGEQSLTYAGLEQASARITACLQAQGVRAGDRVGVCFDRSLHLMSALLGVIRAGATYVPIDASYPAGRISHIVGNARIAQVLTRANLTANLPPEVNAIDVDAVVASATPAVCQDVAGNGDDLFYVIYTSGSTGVPKGAAVYQRSVVNLLHWYIDAFAMDQQERMLLMSAIGFDLTQKNLWAPLLCGARLIIPDFQEYDPVLLGRIVQERGVTWINCAPSAFYPLVDALGENETYAALRWVFLGGEPINFARLASWYRCAQTRLVNSYGPTECTDIAATHIIPRDHAGAGSPPIGRPNYNVRLYVLGASLELLPKGAAGELCIAGDGVGPGYIGDAEMTSRVFVDNPFRPGEKMYRTGDLCRYLPDDSIEYLGRMDQQVKLRGYRIEIGEIQSVINATAGVRESHVAVQKSAATEQLVAWYVCNEGADAEAVRTAIAANVAHQLPVFMRPQAFLALDVFPLTPNGKIDRKALPAVNVGGESAGRPPQTSLEHEVHAIWCKVLGASGIGMEQDFFALGGNSLLATQIVARINKAFDVRVSVRSLFDHNTLEAFCRAIEQSSQAGSMPAIRAGELDGDLPLSYGQTRLWYFEQMNPGSCANNMPGAVRVRGHVDIAGLEFAVNEMVRRHAILRATYHFGNETGPVTRVASSVTLPVMRHDLTRLDADAVAIEIKSILHREANTPFDLVSGPVLRVAVANCPADETGKPVSVIFFCMHHIASDGLSLAVMLRELMQHYAGYAMRRPLLLPELRVQYQDFARWQKQWLESDDLDAQLQYWLKQLEGTPELNTFPTDFERPAVQTTNGNVLQLKLDDALVQHMERFAISQGVTPFIVTLAAWQMVMTRHAPQADVTVGIPTTGRSRPELEPLIGFFINSVLIRSRLDINDSLQAALEHVRDATLQAFAHGDIPLDLLFQRLSVKRSLAHAPIVQVAFQLMTEGEGGLDELAGHFGDLEVEPIHAQRSTAHFDAILSLRHGKGQIGASLEYNSDLYREETMRRIFSQFERVLAQLVEAPEVRLRDAQLLDDAQLKNWLGVPQDTTVLPMTDTQSLLFIDGLVNPDSVQNSIGIKIDIGFPVDANLLEGALYHVGSAYAVYRSRFVSSGAAWAEPGYQVVSRDCHVGFSMASACEYGAAELDVLSEQWIYRPYVVTGVPLVEFRWLPFPDGTGRLLLRAHHIVLDGTSGIFWMDKLFASYAALASGQPLPQWQDTFACFVHQRRAEVDDVSTLAFWRTQFADVLPLSFSRIPDAPRNAGYEVISLPVDTEHAKAIKTYCKANRTHPVDYFRLLTNLLIAHYCRPEGSFVVNEVQSGRTSAKDDTLGVYYGMYPWVVATEQLRGERSFRECFDSFSAYRKETRHYRQLSVRAQMQMLPVGNVLFQYNYFNFLRGVECELGPVDFEFASAHVEKTVQCFVKETADAWLLQLWCDRTVFDDQQFLDRALHLSQQLVSANPATIAELDFILPAEREAIRALSSVTAALPEYGSIMEWFEAAVAAYPQRTAVVCGEQRLDYFTLDARSNQLAHWLLNNGVGKGQRVALLLGRRVEFLVGVLAVLKAGASYVPVETAYPCERIRYILSDCGASVVITEDAALEKLGDIAVRQFNVDHDVTQLDDSLRSSTGIRSAHADEIYVIYTSGSTGQPKGASVTHLGELNLQQWYVRSLALGQDDVTLIISAFGFDLTQKNLFAMLLVGGHIVLPVMSEYDDAIIGDAILQHRVTLLNCAPSAFYPLVEQAGRYTGLSSLRWVVLGGEPIRMGQLRPWLESTHCHARIVNSYGPTECTDVVAFHVLDNSHMASDGLPIGKPVPNCELHVLDEQLRPVPPGLMGELCITGICVGNGYLNKPDQTAAAFVDSPFSGGKLYRTGDLVRLHSDGTLDYIGRKDFQVKLRGLRIELGEIEFALNQCEGISDSLVLVIDDTLVAYVVATSEINRTALREAVRRRVPEYMVPGVIIALPAWPLTPNGKVDRKALPRPDQEDEAHVDPATPVEERLAAIWCELFGREKVSTAVDFFALGGHSLLAVRMVARIAQTFGVTLSVAQMLRASSIQALALMITDAAGKQPLTDTLVTLQAGTGETGILFVHPVGGDVLCYRELVAAMATALPMYGLRAKGLDDDTAPADTLSALVNEYAQLIADLPIRRWYMVGQSLGGTLSIALAESLRQRGISVDALAMIDTFMPVAMNTASDHILVKALGIDLPPAVSATLDYSTDAWIDQLYRYASGLGMVPAGFTLDAIKRIYRVARNNSSRALEVDVSTVRDYRALHIEARNNVARSAEAWRASGLPLSFDEHAGDHESVMRGGNALALAQKIMAFFELG